MSNIIDRISIIRLYMKEIGWNSIIMSDAYIEYVNWLYNAR